MSEGPLGGAGFPTDIFIPFQAVGNLLFGLDDSLNNSAVTTVPFTNVTGVLDGVAPLPFLPYQISPIEFVGGSLNNIVRDSNENIILAIPYSSTMVGLRVAPYASPTYEDAVADLKSALRDHLDAFDEDKLEVEPPILEAFIAEAGVTA